MKTQDSILAIVMAMLAVGMFAQSVYAGPNGMDDLIVVDHQPAQTGGFASDTSFRNMFGSPFSQRIADDFILSSSEPIGAIRWWGFYDQNNPPAAEVFRIRFYGVRPGDGLPDKANVLFEQTVDTPMRTATGLQVAVGVGPDEYLYDTQLVTPIQLVANTPYWLEVIQIGDLERHFRWEFSRTDLNGQAVNNANVGDWFLSTPAVSDTAYQLVRIPEPATAFGLVALGMGGLIVRRKRGAVM